MSRFFADKPSECSGRLIRRGAKVGVNGEVAGLDEASAMVSMDSFAVVRPWRMTTTPRGLLGIEDEGVDADFIEGLRR